MADVKEQHDEVPVATNGVLTKISKVSPFILFGAGGLLAFTGSYFANQQHNASTEAEIKQVIVQHDEAIKDLRAEVIKLRADVVPRSEHEAMLEDNRTIAHWMEKYNDAMLGNLQHQVDKIK